MSDSISYKVVVTIEESQHGKQEQELKAIKSELTQAVTGLKRSLDDRYGIKVFDTRVYFS